MADSPQLRHLQSHIRFGNLNSAVKAVVNDIGLHLYNVSVKGDTRSMDAAHVVFVATETVSDILYPTPSVSPKIKTS